MNGDDELRDRLARLDPAGAAAPVRSYDDPASRQQLEQIMTTTSTESPKQASPRRPYALVAAAAAVIALAIGAFAVLGGDDDDTTDVAAVQLTAPGGASMMSCMAVDAAILADMPVALKGTVTSIDGETITLDVERWYTGGEGDTVQITAPDGLEALIGGIDFVDGETYLVSATDGTVNYCGYSGPAAPDLQSVYDAAFPG